jgi:Histidine kinase-, DNA gyrase B-, and HSP90-like ATPase
LIYKPEQAEYDVAEPHAAVMIESLRAFGYDLKTALADLIDNSITADAANVWLDFEWNGTESLIRLTDDGIGMEETSLFEAMRPGSKSPLEERDEKDLGRFGLGLKTASFSQCRRLTVASKAKSCQPAIRRWDLDYVAKIDRWHLLKSAAPGSEKHLEALKDLPHGTIILWEHLDRVVGKCRSEDKIASSQYLQNIRLVEEYLAMVFHRFMEGGRPQLKIYINGRDELHRVKPWDPFLETHGATILYPNEPIPYGGGIINVKAFVLPHKDKLGDELHKYASGPEGWNAQQGFYVYRNKRLLLAGSWLGLGSPHPWTKEEHYKLARIRIDIPNSLDMDWQIDVKKSTAKPPTDIRGRLRDLADKVRKQAREVFAHRGSYGARNQKQPLKRAWYPVYKTGVHSYRIDRAHPLVKQALELDPGYKPIIEALLATLEETVPIQQIWLDSAEHPEEPARPFERVEKEKIAEVIRMTYRALREKEGFTVEAARQYLVAMDAFVDYEDIISEVIAAEEASK